jgi:hypothetical protein
LFLGFGGVVNWRFALQKFKKGVFGPGQEASCVVGYRHCEGPGPFVWSSVGVDPYQSGELISHISPKV